MQNVWLQMHFFIHSTKGNISLNMEIFSGLANWSNKSIEICDFIFIFKKLHVYFGQLE